jgi:hypothetical protein
MIGFGFLFMLLLIALPVVGIVVLAIWLNDANRRGNPFGVNPPSRKQEQPNGPLMKHLCSQCGTGLQDG